MLRIGDRVHVEFDGEVVDHSAYEGSWVEIQVGDETFVFYTQWPVSITKIGSELPAYDSPQARRDRWGK